MNDLQARRAAKPNDRKAEPESARAEAYLCLRSRTFVSAFMLVSQLACSSANSDAGSDGSLGGSSENASSTGGSSRVARGESDAGSSGSSRSSTAQRGGAASADAGNGGASNTRSGVIAQVGGAGVGAATTTHTGGATAALWSGVRSVGGSSASGLATTATGGNAVPGAGGTAAPIATGTGGYASGSTAGGTSAIDLSLPWDRTAPSFTKVQHPLAPNARLNRTGPLPTNAFWQNVVLAAGTDRFNALPYDIRVTDAGLGASRPELIVSQNSVISPDLVQLRLGATEGLKNPSVLKYDLFSTTLRWKVSGGQMTAPVVYGSPYVSAYYEGLTPSIDFGGSAVLSLESTTVGAVAMQRLDVRLNNGQRWLIYAPMTGVWTKSGTGVAVAQSVTGWVRGALCPSDTAASELDAHAAVVPVGGELSLEEQPQSFRVNIDWKTEGSGLPLMMTLPHHRARLGSAASFTALQHKTLRGMMLGLEAQRWSLEYPRDGIGWRAPRPIASDKVEAVRQALVSDRAYVPVGEDPYFGGKALAKLARLIVIADELGQTESRNEMVERLRPRVEGWLSGTNAVPLAYDEVWGGLVTQRGIADSSQDFGMGYYNDHHFHFGYHIYAAAVIARFLPEWAATWTPKLLLLVRDIANPSASDPHFPRFRNLDWFVGHSWASGLFPFGDGRNQESTSEAVHAWTAVELLGDSLGQSRLKKVGEAMRLVETASAQTYWQVQATSAIYDEPYASRHVVGVLWETKVDFATFFGSNPEFIYGIQMIPFTPSSESLLAATWMRTIEPQISAARSTAADGWKGLLWMGTAVHDAAAAWNGVQQLTGYDDGNSRTNTLYWVATRP